MGMPQLAQRTVGRRQLEGSPQHGGNVVRLPTERNTGGVAVGGLPGVTYLLQRIAQEHEIDAALEMGMRGQVGQRLAE